MTRRVNVVSVFRFHCTHVFAPCKIEYSRLCWQCCFGLRPHHIYRRCCFGFGLIPISSFLWTTSLSNLCHPSGAITAVCDRTLPAILDLVLVMLSKHFHFAEERTMVVNETAR